MAKATARKEVTITLELDMAEAEYLTALLGFHVIGNGFHRTINDRIFKALSSTDEEGIQLAKSLPVTKFGFVELC